MWHKNTIVICTMLLFTIAGLVCLLLFGDLSDDQFLGVNLTVAAAVAGIVFIAKHFAVEGNGHGDHANGGSLSGKVRGGGRRGGDNGRSDKGLDGSTWALPGDPNYPGYRPPDWDVQVVDPSPVYGPHHYPGADSGKDTVCPNCRVDFVHYQGTPRGGPRGSGNGPSGDSLGERRPAEQVSAAPSHPRGGVYGNGTPDRRIGP